MPSPQRPPPGRSVSQIFVEGPLSPEAPGPAPDANGGQREGSPAAAGAAEPEAPDPFAALDAENMAMAQALAERGTLEDEFGAQPGPSAEPQSGDQEAAVNPRRYVGVRCVPVGVRARVGGWVGVGGWVR